MRKLIVCCDGTWNTPHNMDGGTPAPTNVYKFYTAITGSDQQLKYYRSGVGTNGSRLRKYSGGALGYGIDDDIKSPFKWLCDHYRGPTKDQIFVCGFSRGAYTVRSLGGLIGKVGLLDHTSADLTEPEKWEAVTAAYNYYRQRSDTAPPQEGSHEDVPIRFMGVFDTVGALGIPPDLNFMRRMFNRRKYQFHDTVLGQGVKTARHAVAMDERRFSFTPTLWTKIDSKRDIKQIWFPGVHGDIGGSYAQAGLGDITLDWMITEAAKCGLDFQERFLDQLSPDDRGLLHDSVQGGFKWLRTQPRAVPDVNSTKYVHASARRRLAKPPITQSDYWPTGKLKKGAAPVTRTIGAKHRWCATGLYLEKGATYHFEASGEWLDKSLKSGPEGLKNSFQAAGHAVLAGVGRLKRALFSIEDDQTSRAILSRRQDQWPWFALVGVIANGERQLKPGVPEEQDTEPPTHQPFLIGARAGPVVPRESGYLYCYPNDAWHFYGNNRGKMTLTIRRE
ncbi:DUF2235 domain-containing protein [Yoonia sp. BS5-3]|uniref:DUF2235 domain-containing protein n=1 Tax=Yoonia phaeophyticola TaxID=3137369 RepID=A0ABZ3IEF3_9RHOB